MDSRMRSNDAIEQSHGLELDDLVHAEGGANTTHRDNTLPDRQTADQVSPIVPTQSAIRRGALQTWWSANIAVTVRHDPDGGHTHNNDFRDYLALERTYLAHVRTGMALVSFGVVLLQLFRLKDMNPRAGVAFGAVCAGGGAIIVLMGARRYFVLQNKLVRGRISAGGSMIWIDLAIILIIVTAVLAVVLAT